MSMTFIYSALLDNNSTYCPHATMNDVGAWERRKMGEEVAKEETIIKHRERIMEHQGWLADRTYCPFQHGSKIPGSLLVLVRHTLSC